MVSFCTKLYFVLKFNRLRTVFKRPWSMKDKKYCPEDVQVKMNKLSLENPFNIERFLIVAISSTMYKQNQPNNRTHYVWKISSPTKRKESHQWTISICECVNEKEELRHTQNKTCCKWIFCLIFSTSEIPILFCSRSSGWRQVT
jgi:hypothetical protein